MNRMVSSSLVVSIMLTFLAASSSFAQVAGFTYSPTNPCLGQSIQFTDTSVAPAYWWWSFGDGVNSTQQSPSHIYSSPGEYAVYLEVDSGNVAVDTIFMAPGSAVAGPDQIICSNDSVFLNGSIIGSPGTGSWATSGSGVFMPNNATLNATYIPSAQDTTNGGVTLILTATNNSSCADSVDQLIITMVQLAPAQPTQVFGGTSPCLGSTWNYSTSFVTNAESYTWTYPSDWTANYGQGSTIINLTVGTMSGQVCVTASNGCGSSSAQCLAVSTVLLPAAPGSISGSTDVCNGTTQLYIASVLGATSYQWTLPFNWVITSGQGTDSLYVLVGSDSGSVCARACIGCGCSAFTCLSVLSAPSLSSTSTLESCYLCCDGTGTVNATGGTLPYTYLWNDPALQTTAIANGLCTGNYTVTVTDAGGCSSTSSVAVIDSACNTMALSTSSISDFCNVCSGSAIVTASGAIPPYTYMWSNGATSSTITALCATLYYVTVTDNNGCSLNTFATVANTPGFTATSTSTAVSCFGQADGAANVNATGGFPPYTYLWDDPAAQTTVTAMGLFSGWYTVIVVDSTGCTISQFVNVSSPTQMNVTFVTAAPNCGASDGYITATLFGGTQPYLYSWNTNPVQTTSTAISLGSGTYTLSATDANGCTLSDSSAVTDSCGLVRGTVFDDTNGNAIQDVGELGIPGLMVTLSPGPLVGYSDINGNYIITVASFGSYTVSITPPTSYFCSGLYQLSSTISLPNSPGTYTILVDNINPISINNDFGLEPPTVLCGTISGYVWEDVNQDGVQDSGEPSYGGANIIVSNGMDSSFAQADGMGNYSIDVPYDVPVVVSLSLANTSTYFCYGSYLQNLGQTFPTSSADYSVTVTQLSPISTGNDFGVDFQPNVDAGIYSLWPAGGVVPGTDFYGGMDWKIFGIGTCTLRLEFDSWVTFDSANVAPTTIGSDYVEWVLTSAGQLNGCMLYFFTLDSATPPGTELTWFAEFTCTQNEACLTNNTKTTVTTVASPNKSYDINLNKMEVFHTGDSLTNEITVLDSAFSYEIGFQNYGTDTIFSMVIRDTLSPYLNIETLSKPFSSRKHKVEIIPPNVLVLTFDSVMLADTASSYKSSYGFIQFNIRLKPGLPAGTVIENSATIYFDNANPIFTDTVSNTIIEFIGIDKAAERSFFVDVHPNPFSDFTTFQIQGMELYSKVNFELFDLMGQKVKNVQNIPGSQYVMNGRDLNPGIYLYKFVSESRVIGVGKVIVN